MPGRAILTMDDSSWHEELTADWIRKTSYKLHSEQMPLNIPVSLSLPERKFYCRTCKKEVVIPKNCLHGHIDGILEDLGSSEYLWEHKAINHFTFYRIAPDNLPEGYLAQACTYSKGIQEKIAPHIKDGLLLIKNKNTAQYVEIYFQYDVKSDTCTVFHMLYSTGEMIEVNRQIENIVERSVEVFRKVENYKKRKVLPPRAFEFGTVYPCEYCGWYGTCWDGYEEELGELEKDAALSEEIDTMVGYYQELKMHADEIKKQMDEVKAEIKKKLKEKGVAGGKTDRYIVELQLRKRKTIDKALLPPEIIQAATKETTYEALVIRLRKEAKVHDKR
jgi:hypothetical protein